MGGGRGVKGCGIGCWLVDIKLRHIIQVASYSALCLKVHCGLDGFEVLQVVWQVLLLKHQREGRVVAAHTLDGALKAQEALLLDGRRHLAGETAGGLPHDIPTYPHPQPRR